MAAATLLIGVGLIGCSAEQLPQPLVASSAHAMPGGKPTFDAASGLWLIDGYPVPEPGATFDPAAPWMTSSEANRLLGDCVASKGWHVNYESSTSFAVSTPPEQKEAYDADYKQCLVDNRIGTQPSPPLDEALAVEEYAAQQGLFDCLVAAGEEPPPLPSFQNYKEDLLVSGTAFSLYGELTAAGVEVSDLMSSCPDPLDSWGHNGRYAN